MNAEETRAKLRERGWALLPEGSFDPSVVMDPWGFVESLVGERPRMLERQVIRAVPGGRSFASTRGFTPLHTDSQDFLGESPALQVMVCRRPAERGGESLLVDGYAMLEAMERDAPGLYRELFTVHRSIPFYFGTVEGATVVERRGRRVITVSPMAPTDPVGTAFAECVARAKVIEVGVRRGEVLVVDNHRMLHGRRAFEGDEREFVRMLAWMETPVSRPIGEGVAKSRGEQRLGVVLEMTTGVAPARLAAREGITEETLYKWRTRAMAAAREALEE